MKFGLASSLLIYDIALLPTTRCNATALMTALRPMKHKRIWIVGASFAVGSVLCFSAMVLTGAGHGTYLPLSACASPTILSAVLPHGGDNAFLLGLFLAPFYWALLAWIATGSHPRRRVILLSLLFIQYLGAALFLWWSSEDSSVFAKVMDEFPFTLGLFVGAYLVAQLLLWRSAIRAGMPSNAI